MSAMADNLAILGGVFDVGADGTHVDGHADAADFALGERVVGPRLAEIAEKAKLRLY